MSSTGADALEDLTYTRLQMFGRHGNNAGQNLSKDQLGLITLSAWKKNHGEQTLPSMIKHNPWVPLSSIRLLTH